MKVTPTEIEKMLRLLAETPRRIAAATGTLNDNQLYLKPDKNSWSANDILAHLRACADVWSETMVLMLQEDEPTLQDISPRDWLKKSDYPALPFQESFLSFVDQRRELLQTLYDLDIVEWSRGR